MIGDYVYFAKLNINPDDKNDAIKKEYETLFLVVFKLSMIIKQSYIFTLAMCKYPIGAVIRLLKTVIYNQISNIVILINKFDIVTLYCQS